MFLLAIKFQVDSLFFFQYFKYVAPLSSVSIGSDEKLAVILIFVLLYVMFLKNV